MPAPDDAQNFYPGAKWNGCFYCDRWWPAAQFREHGCPHELKIQSDGSIAGSPREIIPRMVVTEVDEVNGTITFSNVIEEEKK